MKRFTQHLRILPLILLSGGVFAFPLPAQAQFSLFSIGGVSSFVVGFVTYVLNYIIGFIGGAFLTFVAWLADLALTLNQQVLDPQASIVQVGWGITRDIANLGFVLIIIIIAFGVMFRFETYGSRKLLTRLIAAAILVNFSLAIMGPFLQFADTLTDFFMSRTLTSGDRGVLVEQNTPLGTGTRAEGFGTMLAGAFGSQRFLLNPNNFSSEADAFSSFGPSMLTNIASLIFTTAFTVIAIIVVATFALMLLVRYLYLVFLGILAPLVWLFWVVPNLSGLFSTWWNTFLKWTFFAPAASFFIYLSFRAIQQLGTQEIFRVGADNFFESGLLTVASQGAQMVVVAGLLIGGLIVAQKMGIQAANVGMNLANKAKAGTLAWAGRQAKRGGQAITDRIRTAGKEYDPAKKETTTRLQRWGSKLQGIPGFTGIGTYIAKQGATVPKIRPDEIDKYRKENLEALNGEGIIARATSATAFIDPSVAAAIGQELAKRDLTADPRVAGLMPRFISIADRMGNAQAIYNNRPDLAPPQRIEDPAHPGTYRDETPEEAIARVIGKIKTADITQVNHKQLGTFNNPATPPSSTQLNAALTLSNPQLGAISRTDDPRQIEAVRNTLTWAQTNRAGLSPEQQQKLDRARDYINRSPHWQSIP